MMRHIEVVVKEEYNTEYFLCVNQDLQFNLFCHWMYLNAIPATAHPHDPSISIIIKSKRLFQVASCFLLQFLISIFI